jgi:hypothetical protein
MIDLDEERKNSEDYPSDPGGEMNPFVSPSKGSQEAGDEEEQHQEYERTETKSPPPHQTDEEENNYSSSEDFTKVRFRKITFVNYQ